MMQDVCSRSVLFALLMMSPVAAGEIGFGDGIQTIFAEHCYECHGPDAERREADLRLDQETSSHATAIVPGDPDKSELIARLRTADADLRMPPSPKTALTDAEIQRVEAWIRAGAKYETHWAFEPVRDTPPTELKQQRGSKSAIDHFVNEQLAEQGLALSPPASKLHLIRRATYDLTGLPPSWQQVTDFVNDASPDAFAKVVDRLLETSAYGERWARHWLDIARYADTHGGAAIGFEKFAHSYTYRDWVINAFNDDLPYNQFVVQQLAADQLGLADNAEELAALGFLRVGMQFRNPHDTIDDQIDVVTRGLLGLTVSCARCHDHKFDAITSADYYSLYSVFANSRKPSLDPVIGKPKATPELTQYQNELLRLQNASGDMARDQSEVMRSRLRMQVGLYLREIAKGAPEVDLSTTNIFSYRTDDIRPAVLQRWRTYLLAMSPDDPVFGIWVRLASIPNAEFADARRALLKQMIAENGKLPERFDGLSATAPKWNPRVLKAVQEDEPGTLLALADTYGSLFGKLQREWLEALTAATLEAAEADAIVTDEDARHRAINSAVDQQLRRHLFEPGTPICMEREQASRLLNRPVNDNLNGRRGAIHNLNLSSPAAPPRAMSLIESSSPRQFNVFRRGNPLDKGAPVAPRFIAALAPDSNRTFATGALRLSLANEIVAPSNPLTRRVLVNWVWQRHFGVGLVRTADDFGTRGDLPTHGRLLDYLASRLLDDGWSIKQLHRRIMLSSVYQQASIERPAARAIDPDNRLLWRMPRRRLEMEAMRDALLAVSGELEASQGGRPFGLLANPVVPHRTVYAFVNRDIVEPIRSTFDAANPNACTAQRPDTTVPQQTLFALNSDFIQDRAIALAQRAQDEAKGTPGVVRALYRYCYAREPDQDELAQAVGYMRGGAARENEDRSKRWAQLAHVLLASNEFVFVD